KFVAPEWNPGAKTVYEKNKDYVPRADPPDGNAGAKLAKVDRVEWIVLPDPFTKSSAIQRGEVDIIDQLPNDQIGVLEKSKDIVLDRTSFLAAIGYIRPNHLYPPFDNPKARQLLKEAGYNGEKVTLINTHEIASIGALGDVTANNLKKLGINVEIAD